MKQITMALVLAVAGLGLVAAPAAADRGCANSSANVGCVVDDPTVDPGDGGGLYVSIPTDWEYYFDDDGVSEGSSAGYETGCWGIRAVPLGDGTGWQEAADEQANQGENGVAWGNCDLEDTIDPAELARLLWEGSVAPPPPTPLQIQPGKAVTGLRSYLEIGGEVPAQQSIPTPIGPATFTMTPRYVVSWGDGASVSTDAQGVPWPGGPGEITHVYQDAGGVRVTVQAFWRTTWTLGGEGGDLPELPVPTEGGLDLPVEEYQVTTD